MVPEASPGPARRGRLTLVLGGARSGKTAFAERCACSGGGCVTYVATGGPGDAEMAARIEEHRRRRPRGWETVEEGLRPDEAVRRGARAGSTLLVDCVALLVSNLLLKELGPDPPGEIDPRAASRALVAARRGVGRLIRAVGAALNAGSDVVMVSNEVGLGLVPANPLGRLFRDALGWANQALASEADEVYLMVAGIPLPLRGGRGGAPPAGVMPGGGGGIRQGGGGPCARRPRRRGGPERGAPR
ncbi:MAG: bifunctional adenosylcobinamide kinase/adenosylcobinamide-phosphate guanylyltransferase [Acetobacteraceae bacterium]|nr:bifunctional adenosylcobinamide kinase/adenosylcobinamide-phosphate guanylyltransferase [Acetobacteraceae bacterium]